MAKGCEGQQEGLLQVYWQQRGYYRKCSPASEWSRELGHNGWHSVPRPSLFLIDKIYPTE